MPKLNEEVFQFKQHFDLLSTHTPEYEFTVPYILANVVEQLPLRGHFVDIGAGRGNLCKPISRHFAETSIVEPNELYFREVLAWAASSGASVTGYNQAWLDADVKEGRVDLCLMSHVLYYVQRESWLAFVRKAYGLLGPGGCIVIILNSLTNDVTRLYKEFLRPQEWQEIASAEAIGSLLREEGYCVEGMEFKSSIYADTSEEIHQLIDFLLLGRASFDDASMDARRARFAESNFRTRDGYAIRSDAGLIVVRKETPRA